MTSDLISTDPERMGGAPVFPGTRVYIQSLFDYIGSGEPLDVFLDDFPSVTREQALNILNAAGSALLAPYESA